VTATAVFAGGLVLISFQPLLADEGDERMDTSRSRLEPFYEEIIPFVYVSNLGGMVGGSPATSQSYYVNRAGMVQRSEETTDGSLQRLQEGLLRDDASLGGLFRFRFPAETAPSAGKSGAHLELSEYFPPRVVVGYAAPSGEYALRSYGADEMSASVQEFVKATTSSVEGSELVDARAGLYVRAQRLPSFDPHIQAPDVLLETVGSSSELLRVLQNEMALIRVGDPDTSFSLSEDIEVKPGQPAHIQFGEIYFRIIAYRLPAESH
jgi:hypothetical protein